VVLAVDTVVHLLMRPFRSIEVVVIGYHSLLYQWLV